MGYRRFIPKSLTVAIVIILAVSGCKPNKPASGGSSRRVPTSSTPVPERIPDSAIRELDEESPDMPILTVGISLPNKRDRFYADLVRGMEKAADELHVNLLINIAEADPAQQVEHVAEFVVQEVSAIVLCPCDAHKIGTALARANDEEIPVFTMVYPAESDAGQAVSFIGSDEVAAGREAAQLLADSLKQRGAVALITSEGPAYCAQRAGGFKEEMASFPNIKIVAEKTVASTGQAISRTISELLESHPELTGIFAVDDDSALIVLDALEAASKVEAVKIVGCGASDAMREKAESGDLCAAVVPNAFEIGRVTICAIFDHLSGEEVSAVIPVRVAKLPRG